MDRPRKQMKFDLDHKWCAWVLWNGDWEKLEWIRCGYNTVFDTEQQAFDAVHNYLKDGHITMAVREGKKPIGMK